MNLTNAFIFDTFKFKYHNDTSVGLPRANANNNKNSEKANHILTKKIPVHFLLFARTLLSKLIWQSKITRLYLLLMLISMCIPQVVSSGRLILIMEIFLF